MHPLFRRRFKDARDKGVGARYRVQLRFAAWAGWLVGFLLGR
jgi:hypothetical protein